MAHILLVDDDPDVVETTALILKAEGYAVELASNGQEGLEVLDRRLPDLVILDLEMPVLNGQQMALRMLLDNCGKEDVPIVLVSGAADLKEIAGMVGTPYRLAKPYHIDAFLGLVARALKERATPSSSSSRSTG